MLHPHTEVRHVSETVGVGIFATKLLPKGTVVWALDQLDQVFDPPRIQSMGPDYMAVLDKFTYTNGRGERILCWDSARLINHSCEPNILSPGLEFEIAVRDIHPGEQVVSDYASYNVEAPFECHCQSPRCRGVVRPEDFEALATQWDAQIRQAFAQLERLPQALWPWVRDKERVNACVRDLAQLPSISVHRYVPVVRVGAGLAVAS